MHAAMAHVDRLEDAASILSNADHLLITERTGPTFTLA